jgi:hypothetical protein
LRRTATRPRGGPWSMWTPFRWRSNFGDGHAPAPVTRALFSGSLPYLRCTTLSAK